MSTPAQERPPGASPTPWARVLDDTWRPVVLGALAAVALATFGWECGHLDLLFDYVLRATDRGVQDGQAAERRTLIALALAALVPAVAHAVWLARRARRGHALAAPLPTLLPAAFLVAIATAPLPILALPTFEYEHPFLTGMVLLGLALAASHLARVLVRIQFPIRPPGDLSPRAAWAAVGGGVLVFVAVIGFLSHWRFVTFHAEPFDTSFETNAVWGIIHHGIPTNSVGAEAFYRGKALPAVYFDSHVPLAYYLYAPFYALYQDTRTLLWLQALFMASGAAGVFLAARRWLRCRWLAVVMAWAYLLHPAIQNHCLHDVHANILAIPALLLALGLMEAGRPRWALAWAIVAALCREETPVYAACLGLFWIFGRAGSKREGAAVIAASAVLIAFTTQWLMPHYGGQPGWRHYDFFFLGTGMASVAAAFLFNPLAALASAGLPMRFEFLWLTLVPTGLLALAGWRGGWFAITAVALLFASGDPAFYCPGMNYSAPIMPAAIVMGLCGVRAVLRARAPRGPRALRAERAAVGAFLLVMAVGANVLWGNILSKTYKLEYGFPPYLRMSENRWRDLLVYAERLPPYGQRERQLWEVIHRVPPGAPIATSWSINPQLSSRDVAMLLPYLAESHPRPSQPRYAVIDKLPPLAQATEAMAARFRRDPAWRVFYENPSGVIFERLKP